MKNNKKIMIASVLVLALVLIIGVPSATVSAATPKNYEIDTSNPQYSKDDYCKKITFSGKKVTIKGKFALRNSDRKSKITIKIASNCKFYYGEGKISYSKIKKMIKKNKNNCYVLFGVTVKKGKAVSIGLYA